MARLATAVCLALLACVGGQAGASLAAGNPEPGGFPVATGVRLGGDARQTRLVVDLTRRVPLNAFALADPYRVVIDLPQVVFQLPRNTGQTGRGLVNAFRYGAVMPGGSRIVLDLAAPARIETAFSLDAAAGQPARLILDLAATDRESFLHAVALDNRRATRSGQSPPLDPPVPAKGDRRPVIVIDPGHGGIDEGAQAPNGVAEKTIVLEFGTRLRDALERTGNYRVLMTRTDDSFVSLADRVRFARSNTAALLVSVHADSIPRGDARGASIYTLSDTASDAEAAGRAEAENRADIIAGVDLSAEPDDVAEILFDLAQRETRVFSVQFARTLASEMKSVARMHRRPVKSAGFRVLRAADVPSVLLELGYISNREDFKLMTSEDWQTRTAEAIAKAIDSFFSGRLVGAEPALRTRD